MGKANFNRFYFLVIWTGVVPLLSSASITLLIIKNEPIIAEFSFWQWGIFYLLSVFTMTLAITPTTFMALISGFFLGIDGIIPIVISYQLASLIGYYLAGKLDEGFLQFIQVKYPKSRRIIDNLHQNQLGLTFLSRLSPALPFAIMNVVLSVSGIRLLHFFWGGLIGMLPRTLLFVWVGLEASKLSDAMVGNENIYITIGISVLILFIIYKLLNRSK